ncbi:hypothetical protein GPECTOR_23g158 [Gonium pectorale]|uniref:Ankyrin repeat domain-containing protein n=1 Tax=Gonium pectorale TaxID=33097 RepID=A0A150GH06_GONPE|nr:hypothetical protein GPECTOR_23g158 [Gonium pectorale]|eukprot:KXZ49073.1 hypothetical protein GPECTOR_23g158 [Gonium pectorale]
MVPDSIAYILSSAAGSPTSDWAAKVEWLEAQGALRSEDAAAKAVSLPDDGGALARLTWLRGRGYPVDGDAVLAAARSGNTTVLQYLLAEVPADDAGPEAAFHAAGGGHLASLQALHTAGWLLHQYSNESAILAARGGHLHVLAWLLEAQLSELNSVAFKAAAGSGSVEVLAWLRQRGCPWDSHAYSEAVKAGCEAALEWLVEQGCPMEDSGQPYIDAWRSGDLAMARCLRRLGVPWGPDGKVFFFAAATAQFAISPLPLLRWMLEHGCPVDRKLAAKRMKEWRRGMPQRARQVLEQLGELVARRQP